jgi:uncharacterized protein with PQ loop repeat
MSPTGVLGLVCTALSVGFVWPQVLRVYRLGTVEGLAATGTLHGLSACVLWTMYGSARGVAPLVVSNAAIGVAMGMIAAAQLRHGTLRLRWLVAVLAGVLAVGGACLAISTTLTGTVAIVVGVTAILPQTLHVARAPSLEGVSLPMYALVLTSTVLWSAYGLLVDDYLLITTNVLIAPCASYVAVRAWRSQRLLALPAELP